MVNVPVLVPTPAAEPYFGGLFTAAPPKLVTDPHILEEGLQYKTLRCGNALGTWSACLDLEPAPDAPADKTYQDDQVVYVQGTPFTVLASSQCGVIGHSLAEHQADGITALELHEEQRVEQAFWTGDLTNFPNMQDCADITPTPGTAVCIEVALGLLEKHLCGAGGTGFIHASRDVAAQAASASLVNNDNGVLRTPLGNRWVFGCGYPGDSPAGAAPADGTSWMRATGPVNVWRSERFLMPEDVKYAVNTTTNQFTQFVERTYIVTYECVCASILVQIC
jgi:hypothetical protein